MQAKKSLFIFALAALICNSQILAAERTSVWDQAFPENFNESATGALLELAPPATVAAGAYKFYKFRNTAEKADIEKVMRENGASKNFISGHSDGILKIVRSKISKYGSGLITITATGIVIYKVLHKTDPGYEPITSVSRKQTRTE